MKDIVIVDCTASIGGNSMSFIKSKFFKNIYSIEKNLITKRLLKKNLKLFERHHKLSKINYVIGNSCLSEENMANIQYKWNANKLQIKYK